MVAATVPRLVSGPVLSRAQQTLGDGLVCLDAGDAIGAGVRIRQAARLLLLALAEACGIRRPLHEYPRPARLARALYHAGRIDAAARDALLALIAACNATAHCEEVPPSTLRAAADELGRLFDAILDEGGRPQ